MSNKQEPLEDTQNVNFWLIINSRKQGNKGCAGAGLPGLHCLC